MTDLISKCSEIFKQKVWRTQILVQVSKAVYDSGFFGSVASGSRGGSNHARLSGGAIQHVVQAYTTMNKFLARFLEHALRDLDFVVKDRLFLESVLDIEFEDASISEKVWPLTRFFPVCTKSLICLEGKSMTPH